MSEITCRVTCKMLVSVAAAVLLARTLLQSGARAVAKHATDELYQLTIIAFCLVGAWISGYLVRPPPPLNIPRTCTSLPYPEPARPPTLSACLYTDRSCPGLGVFLSSQTYVARQGAG